MKAGRLAAILAVALMAGGIGAADAAGGPSRYVFEKCDHVLPGGGVEDIVYAPHPTGFFSSENTCSQPNGALVVRQNQIPKGNGGGANWAVPVAAPAGASLESVTVTAGACGVTEPLIWSVQWIQPPGVWPGTGCAADVRSFRLTEGSEANFFIELQCRNWSGEEDRCHAGPWIFARDLAITVLDPAPPSLEGLRGSILGEGIKRGRQGIGAVLADVGGGLSAASVLVNGVPPAQPKAFQCRTAEAENRSVIGTVAAEIAPCPANGEADWIIDTGAYPFHDGANTVVVCASDFATLSDPNTTCSAPQIVTVDNSCHESPVGGGDVLSAQFESSNTQEVTVGFGRPAIVTGRLANDAGDPIRGAKLCLKMATIGIGERPANVGSAVTDAEGRYRYEVTPGPNRELTVGYRHDSRQVAREVRYYAHARPSLRVSSGRVENGDRVRFWGQLPGPRNEGRVVVLQAGTVGSKRWITFRKASARNQGVFRAAYRFSSTTRRTKYKFRAVVPRQAGYPWEAGRSRPVRVLVRPG